MLTRWDPFREMVSMRRAMDRLIESSYNDQGYPNAGEWSVALDVIEKEDRFVVKATLPGVKSDDIEVTFNKGMLVIRGEMKDESESEAGQQYHLRERRYGAFTRSISLPASINGDDIQADFDNGVLTLNLPKAEEVKPKRIAVKAGSGTNTLDAKAQESNQ